MSHLPRDLASTPLRWVELMSNSPDPTLRLCVEATGSLADNHGARAIAADRELATAGESREDAEAADRPIARAFPWAESAELSVRVTVWA